VLAVFGGNAVYLGENVAAAATMDLATLSYIYGASAGFFQGAALAQAAGLDVAAYADIVQKMTPSFGDFLQHEGKVVASGDFAISQSPLSISVGATERIHREMVAAGVNAELPALLAGLLRRADAAGYGREEFAAVVKLLAPA
jgi:3-hydroxyisobutyrate dehydrogenase-like beta-hydroxyacid dehydrogenase